MTVSQAHGGTTPAHGERLTVTLIPKVWDDLRQLEERTNLSRTDLANRAITLYEFFDAQIRAGRSMIARDNETGTTELVQLLDAPVGQALDRRPRRAAAGATVPSRRPGRHRRSPALRLVGLLPLAAMLAALVRVSGQNGEDGMSTIFRGLRRHRGAPGGRRRRPDAWGRGCA